MAVATFPITDVSLRGAWTVPFGGPQRVSFGSLQSQLVFRFVGTQIEILLSADTGADNTSYDSLQISIDGGTPVNAGLRTNIPGSSPQWIISATGLTEGLTHTAIVQPSNPYYISSANWAIDVTTPVRITGTNPSVSLPSNYIASNGKLLVCHGDSRTFGTGSSTQATNGRNFGPNIVGQINNGSFPGFDVFNAGSYSELASRMLERFPYDIAPLANPNNTRNALFFWGGINDINSGTSFADMQTLYTNYARIAKASGFSEIIVGTIPYIAGQGPNDDVKTSVNAWLRTNYNKIGFTGMADIDADPAFSSHASTADWDNDSLHLADSGYTKAAAIVINAFANQVVSAGTPPTETPVLTAFPEPAGGGNNITTDNLRIPAGLGAAFYRALTDEQSGGMPIFVLNPASAEQPPLVLNDNTVEVGLKYFYYAQYTNQYGSGPSSATVNSTAIPTVPSVVLGFPSNIASAIPQVQVIAPTNLVATAMNKQVLLQWINPVNLAGIVVQRRITVASGAAPNAWVSIATLLAETLGNPATVPSSYLDQDTMLVNGTEYDYEVYGIV